VNLGIDGTKRAYATAQHNTPALCRWNAGATVDLEPAVPGKCSFSSVSGVREAMRVAAATAASVALGVLSAGPETNITCSATP